MYIIRFSSFMCVDLRLLAVTVYLIMHGYYLHCIRIIIGTEGRACILY